MPSPSSPPTSSPPSSLIIHTLNTPRTLKSTAHGQAADAIHQTLHFALDGRAEDWQARDGESAGRQPCGGSGSSTAAANGTSTTSGVKPGFLPHPSETLRASRPYISYLHAPQSSLVHIPHPFAIPDPIQTDPCAVEERDRFDVTAKFFFQEQSDGEGNQADHDNAYLQEALGTLQRNTGLLTVDTLLLSWPSIIERWAGKSSSAADEQRFQADLERIRNVWQTISASPYVSSLGLSDLPIFFLEALFPQQSPTSSSPSPSPPHIPSNNRLPRVISLNAESNPPCASQAELVQWCKRWSWSAGGDERSGGGDAQDHIQILSHSDPKDVLPTQSLPSVLKEFESRIPVAATPSSSSSSSSSPSSSTLSMAPSGWSDSLRTTWLIKYTVLISDRGVLADAGYIVRAQQS